MAVEIVGPFQYHKVVVNGWRVPFLHAHPAARGGTELVLDHRLSCTLSESEAEAFVPFLADAIAVALGFACHPSSPDEELVPAPRVAPRRTMGLEGDEPEGRPPLRLAQEPGDGQGGP